MGEKDEPKIIDHVPGFESEGQQPSEDKPGIINEVPENSSPRGILGVVAEDGRVIPIKKEDAPVTEIISDVPKDHPKPRLRLVREIISRVPGFGNSDKE